MSSPGQANTIDAVAKQELANVAITPMEYHGWPGSYLISNGVAEVVVVPVIGRVMQFRMSGDEAGVFWENRALDGQLAAAPEAEWANFGGDKVWPAPQDDWIKITGRPWPPPLAFDSMPLQATVKGSELVLTSPVDPHYGIQTVRCIALHPSKAKLAIRTAYHKVSGPAVKSGIWFITQLREPQRVFALLPEEVKHSPGFYQMQGPAPHDFQHQGRLISLRRDPANNLKIGAEGRSLLWIGDEYVLHIDHDHAQGATSIYTNMDPLPYVELETEGPLVEMNAGDRIEMTNIYELTCRTTPDVMAEARQAFGLTHE
jgi:hypothetical protein